MAVSNTADLQKLLALAPAQRNVLLSLPADTLQTLAARNSTTQLAVLANRMLEPAQSPTAAVKIAEDVAQGNVTIERIEHAGEHGGSDRQCRSGSRWHGQCRQRMRLRRRQSGCSRGLKMVIYAF